jgi:hypothetical protein
MHDAVVTVGSGRPRIGLAASLLLHALAIMLLLLGPRWETLRPQPPREAPIEVVLLPAPEPKPAPPRPAPPPPEVPARILPPPPPPQLTEAPIAETSTPPPGPERPATGAPTPGPVARPAPPVPAPPAAKGDVTLGGAARPGAAQSRRARGDKPATQAEKDFILAQILPFWLIDYRNPRFGRIVFGGTFVLQADGMLGPPYGKNDPWQPEVMVSGYSALLSPEREPERVAIESFLNAVRAAQPFRLPPTLDKADYPRPIPVHFRLGDL